MKKCLGWVDYDLVHWTFDSTITKCLIIILNFLEIKLYNIIFLKIVGVKNYIFFN